MAGVVGYFVSPNIYAATDPWKWAFAIPIGLILAAGLSGAKGKRLPWLSIAAFAIFGALNLTFGFRRLVAWLS